MNATSRGKSPAPWFLAGFAVVSLAVALVLTSCGKKSLTAAQIHAITGEIVSAAQKAAQRGAASRPEITIRPEIETEPPGGGQGRLAADDIYVSLANPSEQEALGRALDEIVRRHNLSISESSSGGVERFDLAFEGSRTHTVHIVTPIAARRLTPAPRSPSTGAGPRLAIIVDDLGYDRAAADSLLALPFPLTVSVLPYLPLSADVAEEAWRRGDQVLLHMPMEAVPRGGRSEELELRVGMNADEVASLLGGMLETVPHAAGVNNHQGSRATADPALMKALMPELRQRGLFFIDSRTTAATVAYQSAESTGVRAASRNVFLDDVPTRDAVLAQLALAARDAVRNGAAIAIGHPHPETIAALAEGIPRLEARGIRLVFASDIARAAPAVAQGR